MSARLLLVVPRDEGSERLTVTDAGDVVMAIERPALEGWRLVRRVVVRRSELARVVSAMLGTMKPSAASVRDEPLVREQRHSVDEFVDQAGPEEGA